MANFRNTGRNFTHIAAPYFKGDDRWPGRILLASVIALQLFQVWLNVKFNAWYNTFYNALQNKDWDTFIYQFGVFTVLAAAFIVTAVYQLYLQQWLQIRWRRWLTDRYLSRWLGQGTHYRMRLKGDQADNPDQRISDDIRMFVNSTLDIGISLLGSIVTLASFVVILWNLSAASPLMIGSHTYNIPGYLVWAALIYAVIGTFVTHLVGKPLVKLNFDQQRYEADFRFSLVRLRENAEEVTLLSGEAAEEERLRDRFARVVSNWYGIMQRTKRLTFLTAGYSQVAIIFPFLVVSPVYFFGALTLGGLMQISSAFGQVQSALSFFVTAYSSIADWKAVLDRLAGFESSIDWAQGLDKTAPRVELIADGGSGLHVKELSVGLPNGEEIVRLSDFSVEPGDRVLVTGPSGSGKTSLFRALGGVWPFGAGAIRIPKGNSVLVLPQNPYIPLGSLRGALAYPAQTSSFGPGEIEEVLDAVGLSEFRDQLDETAYWADKLSGGEEQRLSIARALLQKPQWLFLDEATSALDEAAEAELYRLLLERLPDTAIISIGHRSSLIQFHARFFELKPEAPGRHRLAEAVRRMDTRKEGKLGAGVA
ncbi:ABC transporter ATP-binding protein/permease [Methyloceanibacter sp.]|uniref:ABC transporter ATP-binding protein/permease n=1 Tax=Methyloceanibacter sp. TaxID=1965321 RepID=UPI002D2A0ED4|nr:ABC transporter ATP-binding protein/permease [Methyloceanibacter sp.]HZP09066.1 ABC transporter ATP-binding protein/permease [Methyloceanibacter sp.]